MSIEPAKCARFLRTIPKRTEASDEVGMAREAMRVMACVRRSYEKRRVLRLVAGEFRVGQTPDHQCQHALKQASTAEPFKRMISICMHNGLKCRSIKCMYYEDRETTLWRPRSMRNLLKHAAGLLRSPGGGI